MLIRDTLYEGLTTARRVRLHRQAVEALESLYGDESGPHLAELAHHAIAGSDFDRGARYARRAADRALALLAYEEAARLYATALEALDLAAPSDEQTRCDLLLSLGEAEDRAGDSLASKRAFLAASELARHLALPRELARAAAGYGGRIVWARGGDDHRLIALLEEGLAALSDEDVELRARLLARLAGALRDEPSPDRRDRLSREAVELARHTGNPAALAYALDGRTSVILAPDTVAECLVLGGELREVAERIGDTERALNGRLDQFIVHVVVGDIRDPEAEIAAMSLIADELRQPAQLWQVCAARAMLALAAGRLAEAELLIPQAFALGERAIPQMAIPVHRLQQSMLCDFRGSLEDAEPALRELVADYPARPALRCALAHLQARLGRQPEAQRALHDLAENGCAALPFDQEWLFGMSLLAETAGLLGDTRSAETLYGLLAPWNEFVVADHPEGIRGSVSRYLGILAATTTRWPDAAGHFERALELNERMGFHPWVARTQDDYARMLLARNEPGDGEHARELLERALATYRELGMEPDAAR